MITLFKSSAVAPVCARTSLAPASAREYRYAAVTVVLPVASLSMRETTKCCCARLRAEDGCLQAVALREHEVRIPAAGVAYGCGLSAECASAGGRTLRRTWSTSYRCRWYLLAVGLGRGKRHSLKLDCASLWVICRHWCLSTGCGPVQQEGPAGGTHEQFY